MSAPATRLPARSSAFRLHPRAAAVLAGVRHANPGVAATYGPGVFLLSGLPGAGKTTFAERLAAATGAVVLESDRVRQMLFATPVFSMQESGVVFRAILGSARALLAEGRPVVIDATNLSEKDRRPFSDLADNLGAPLLVVRLDAPVAVIEQRLRARESGPDGYSLADLDVYHRMKGRVEAISREHWTLDTSTNGQSEIVLAAVVAAYRGAAGQGGQISEQA